MTLRDSEKDFTSPCDWLRAAVATRPEAPAVLTDGDVLSYAELGRRARAIAALLAPRIGTNPRVALLADNGSDYVTLYWAILLAGGVSVELNPGLGKGELTTQLQNADAGLLIAEAGHRGVLGELGGQASGDGLIVDSLGSGHGDAEALATQVTAIVRGEDPGSAGKALPPLQAGQIASIVHTSGTTGQVKGVCLTHGNLAWAVQAIARSFAWEGDRSDERLMGNLPLFYTYGKSILHLATYLSAPIVFTRRILSPQALLGVVREHAVTHLPLVPYVAALLLQAKDFSRQSLPALRLITIAGGALPRDLMAEMVARFPAQVVTMYGLTEASTRVACMPRAEGHLHLESCGKPLAGLEVRILDEQDRPVARGDIGEIAVRGPNVMASYFRDPETTTKVVRNGWLHSGDLGFLNDAGYLTIAGRRKDVIKVMGESVSALSVEAAIMALPQVEEVAVKGVSHSVTTEAIAAFVVLRKNMTLSADEIRRHCARELGRVRVPAFVQWVASLPKTASGKVRKHLLVLDEAP